MRERELCGMRDGRQCAETGRGSGSGEQAGETPTCHGHGEADGAAITCSSPLEREEACGVGGCRAQVSHRCYRHTGSICTGIVKISSGY